MHENITKEMIEFVQSINKKIIESNYTYQYPKTIDSRFTTEYFKKVQESKWEETAELTEKEKVMFFLWYPYSLCPFDYIWKLVTKVLDRPVYNSEFAFIDELKNEFLGKREKMSTEEHINNISKINKNIIVIKP
jgi:hypothetical protein